MEATKRAEQLEHEAGILTTVALHYRAEAEKSLKIAQQLEALAELAGKAGELEESDFRALVGQQLAGLEKAAGQGLQSFRGSFDAT